MTTTQTPATLLALHAADPEGLRAIAAELAGIEQIWSYALPERVIRCDVPKWSTSLDAVAELEAGLTDEERGTYALTLAKLVGCDQEGWFHIESPKLITAPAHLRLVAWVLTKQTI